MGDTSGFPYKWSTVRKTFKCRAVIMFQIILQSCTCYDLSWLFLKQCYHYRKCLLSSNGKYAHRFGGNLSEDAGKFNPDFYGFWHHDYHRVLDNNFTPCKDEWWDIMDFLKEREWDFAYVMEDYDETSCDRPDCILYRGGGGVEQAAWNTPENRYDLANIEGILSKGSYLPCVNMAGRALLAGYPRHRVQW